MAKTTLRVVLLFLAASTLFGPSCTNPQEHLRAEITEGGFYPVQIVKIESTYDKADEYWIYSYAYTDASVNVTAEYAQVYNGGAVYPNYTSGGVHLDSFQLTWKCADTSKKLPPVRNAGVDMLVPITPDGKSKVTFAITVMPAATKETCTALAEVSGVQWVDGYLEVNDPTAPQLSAVGTVTLVGHDLITNEKMTATSTLNAVFAVYSASSKGVH